MTADETLRSYAELDRSPQVGTLAVEVSTGRVERVDRFRFEDGRTFVELATCGEEPVALTVEHEQFLQEWGPKDQNGGSHDGR